MQEIYDRFGKISMGGSSYRHNMMTRASFCNFFYSFGKLAEYYYYY